MRNPAAIFIALVLLSGCADPQKDWELASRDDSPEALLEFLAKHPDSEQAELARQRIGELKVIRAWERAEFKATEEAYAGFVDKYPDSEFVTQAQMRIADIERDRQWVLVADAGTGNALREFLANYPDAPQAEEAQALLVEVELAEQAALAAATPKERPGAFRLQLAAFRTPASAEQEVRRLVELFPNELLGPVRIETPAERTNGSSLFLLKTVPMSGTEAREVCALLQARKQQCMVVNR
ncbi:MAG: SPOR domain-containing protein [Gammaproteobacteria bacterium]